MDEESTKNRLLLSVPAAAARLSLGRSKFLELLYAGTWPTVRIGRAVRMPAAALEEWVAHQVEEAQSGQDLE